MRRSALLDQLAERLVVHRLPHPLRVAVAGSRLYRRAAFDYRSDTPRTEPPLEAPEDAVLLVDGVFLLRPELAASWDVRLFVSAAFDECLRRALDRDTALFGTSTEVERRYRSRYIPAQEHYLAAVRPTAAADLVIRNDDPASPRLEEGTAAGSQV